MDLLNDTREKALAAKGHLFAIEAMLMALFEQLDAAQQQRATAALARALEARTTFLLYEAKAGETIRAAFEFDGARLLKGLRGFPEP